MLLVILLGTLAPAYQVTNFRPRPFGIGYEPGLYEVTTGLESPGTVLSAFAFINGGTECDVLVLNEDRCAVTVYTWSRKEGRFIRMVVFDLQLTGSIHSITPCDFNNDGATDLLITRTWKGTQIAEIYLQVRNSFQSTPAFTFSQVLNHPIILDINGDMSLDILYNTVNETGQVSAYILEECLDNSYVSNPLLRYKFQSAVHCLNPTNEVLSTPHSVAFVDLNGDCLADMFLTTVNSEGEVFFEVWLNMKNGEYCVVQISKAPRGAGQVSFADVDGNGEEDLVFWVCTGEKCQENSYIQVAFNDNQAPSLCLFENSAISTHVFVPFELNYTQFTSKSLIVPLPSHHHFAPTSADMPLRIQTGDFDEDGYPELLLLLDDGLGPYCALLQNLPAQGLERRSFALWPEAVLDKLRGKRGAYLCSFFDLDENGVLDILLTLSLSGHSYTYSLYNVPQGNSMHLKALMLAGAGQTALTGAAFVFTQRKLDFSVKVVHGSQLAQTAYFALQVPYCLFGLGKDTIAIENFVAAMPTIAHSARLWTPLIPQSSVIIRPFQTDVSLWQLDLYSCPKELVARVMLACLAVWAVIGLWAVIRLRGEQRQLRELCI